MSLFFVAIKGFGNGTIVGSTALVATNGYSFSTIIPAIVPVSKGSLTFGMLGNGILSAGSTDNGNTSKGSL